MKSTKVIQYFVAIQPKHTTSMMLLSGCPYKEPEEAIESADTRKHYCHPEDRVFVVKVVTTTSTYKEL